MRKMCKVLSMAMILSTIAGTGAISMSVPSLKVDAATTTASQTNVNASVTASGASFKDVNGNNYQVLDKTTKTVAFYRVNTNEDKNSTLVIPQTINVTENGTKVKYTVTEIGKKDTAGNYMSLVGDASTQNKFKEIIIPDSVVVIHANAFNTDIIEDGGNIQLGKDENFKGLKLKIIENGAFSSAIKNLTVSTYKLDDMGYSASIISYFTNNITFKCYFMSAIWKNGVNGKSLKCAWAPVAPINFGTGMMKDGAGNKFYVGVGTTSNCVMTKSNNKINYPVFELYAYNYGDTLTSNGTTVSNALFNIDNATTKKFLKIQVDYNKKRMKFTPKDSATMTGTQLITGLDNTTDITNTKIVKTEVLKPAYLKFDSEPTPANALSTLQNVACLRIKYKNGSSVILPNKSGSASPLVTWTATSYKYGELKFNVAPVEANIKLFRGTYSSSVNVLNPKSATTNKTNFTVTKTSDGKRLQVNVQTNNPRYYYVVDYATAPGTTYQTLYDGKAAKTKGYDVSKVNTIPYSKTRDYVVRVRVYNYPNADGLVDTSYNAAYEGGITVRNPDGKGAAKYFVQRSNASTANIYFFGKRDGGYKISIYKRVNNTRPALMELKPNVYSDAMTPDSTFGGCVYKYELTSKANNKVSDILYYYAVIKDSTGKVIDAQGVNANGVSAFSFAPNAGDSTKIKTTQVYRVENKSVMLRPEQTDDNCYKNGTYVKMYMTLRNQPESELDFSNSKVQYKYQNGVNYTDFATGGAIGLVDSVSAFDKMSSSQKNAYKVWHTKDNKVWWVRPDNGSYSEFILKIPLKGDASKFACSESVTAITGVCTGIDHKTTVKMNNTELQEYANTNITTGSNGIVTIQNMNTVPITVISADMATSGNNVRSIISDSYKLDGYPVSSSVTYKVSKITTNGSTGTLGATVVTSNDLSKFKSLKLQEGYYDFTVNYQYTNPDKGSPAKYSTAPKDGNVTKHYIFRVVKAAQKCNITASRVNYSVNDELTSTLKITTLDGKRIKMTDAEFTEWKKTHFIRVDIISDVPTVSANGTQTETIVATYFMNNTTNNFTPIKSGQYITGFTTIYTPTTAILAENHVFTARATLTEGVSKSVANTTFRIDANGGATG